MARIVNNRICYPTHNILVERTVWTMDHMLKIEAALTPDGNARLHRAQLDSFPNVGTYCEIENPTIIITPYWADSLSQNTQAIPPRMHIIVTLHDGNKPKVLCSATCDRSESFYPLYGTMEKLGIDVGRKARREAETEYFKKYDALVASANASKE